MDKLERMKELVATLTAASKAYYQQNESPLTDFAYDKLYDELVQLEAETGTILSQSPTQQVGYQVLEGLTKVRHAKRMLSLDKTKEVSRLEEWLGDKTGILSWKLDGLTIVLRYENGTLAQAVTRGNGEVGEDITHNAKVFSNLPLQIPFLGELVLRGEGIIPFGEFERINKTLPDEEKYKNPRNLCSGTVRQLNSEIAAERNVRFYTFTLVSAAGADLPDEKDKQLAWLVSLGFPVVEHRLVTAQTVAEAVRDFEAKIPQNDFASDGLVLTFQSASYGASLGETSKFPKDSIAFKWKDETAQTTLLEMDWSTSRTGLINPVAVFSPVELEGTTVNRASVHNVSICKELQLGIGDQLLVYKANMIIPQIAENLTRSGNLSIPTHCPVCGGETEIRALKDGEALYCTNPNCHAQRVKSLSHFASRDAMNIEGLSEETIKKFVEQGFVETYVDLFHLEPHGEAIMAMEGFGKKSWTKLQGAMEKAKQVPMANFLYALGINHVGLSNAKLLCQAADFQMETIQTMTEEELQAIDGFGAVIAHSVHSYFADERNQALLQEALSFLHLQKPEASAQSQKLSGMSFVVTGDVHLFQNRKELQAKIESLGGKVTGSVTGKTVCLINNDILSTSGKNKKAKELGVPILSEEDFVHQYLE